MILSELKELSPLLAGIPAQVPYTLPHNYFEQFPDLVVEKIFIAERTSVSNLYPVPRNYFEQLPENIMLRIKTQDGGKNEVFEELEEVAPFLNTIPKTTPYSVPGNYFSTLVPTAEANAQPAARIVSFRKTRKFITYFAAAVMAGVLVTGAYLYTGNSRETFDFNKEVNNLSDDELESYLDTSFRTSSYTADTANLSEVELPDMQENLQMISDEELQKYVTDNEEPTEKSQSDGSGS